jgi:hypothetical protein
MLVKMKRVADSDNPIKKLPFFFARYGSEEMQIYLQEVMPVKVLEHITYINFG